MYCRNCNKQIPDSSKFCTYCGAQQVQQNEPAVNQIDDDATVVIGYGKPDEFGGANQQPVSPEIPQVQTPECPPSSVTPENPQGQNTGFQPPLPSVYQQPVNSGYQPSVTPAYTQGQDAGFQPPLPPVNPAYQQPAPAKKKKKGLVIGLVCGGIVLLIIVGIIVAFALADSGSDYDDSFNDYEYNEFDEVLDEYNESAGNNLEDSENSQSAESETANPAFEQLFEDVGITLVEPADFGSEYEYAAFAYVDEYGELFLQEYAYIGDTIYKQIESIVYPVADFTQTEKDVFIEEMDAVYAEIDALDCATVSHVVVDSGFIVYEIRYEDLDSYAAIKELQSVGGVEAGFATSISFKMTEENLIEEGFVKK